VNESIAAAVKDYVEGADTRPVVERRLSQARARVARLQREVDVLESVVRSRNYLTDRVDLDETRLELQLAKRELAQLEGEQPS
jgi:hypothetical protein